MPSLELFSTNWRDVWRSHACIQEVGSVYTRPEIVDLILDLGDYRVGAGRLVEKRIIEPSCGDGAFLRAILGRLIRSESVDGDQVDWDNPSLDGAITAVDISEPAVAAARALIIGMLTEAACPQGRARQLAETWASQTDFLLAAYDGRFDLVVGNPPYVRLEGLPKPVLGEYRSRYSTLTDRADLYVAFIERGLDLLGEGGILAFICANRFAKNQYGAALRRLIGSRYRVRQYINLEHTQPFLENVSAYPAIIAIDKRQGSSSTAGTLRDLEPETLEAVRAQAMGAQADAGPLAQFVSWYPDGRPWTTTSPDEFEVFAKLESKFPTLEESGGLTRVGIGVATGADEVFVLAGRSELVEAPLQLPLLMAADVRTDTLRWSGHFLINPFSDRERGGLVDLNEYPGLKAYLKERATLLKGRHVARSRPNAWYRTIDRVWPALRTRPKLVIPDIQRGGVIGVDDGLYYPHHNLYWVTSDAWDLRALQAIMRSTHVVQQVRAISVQMRGGSVRYQAQTLRRIRVPSIRSLSSATLEHLVSVARSADQIELDEVVAAAFGYQVTTPRAGSSMPQKAD